MLAMGFGTIPHSPWMGRREVQQLLSGVAEPQSVGCLSTEDSPLTAGTADAYRIRFRKVLAHIDAHLDDDLTVDRLSGVAAFSKYHFHRQFSELFGIGVYRYVQLVRLKRASYQLAFRDQHRIIDIALASGYESHEAFSRAFKKTVGQTPVRIPRAAAVGVLARDLSTSERR